MSENAILTIRIRQILEENGAEAALEQIRALVTEQDAAASSSAAAADAMTEVAEVIEEVKDAAADASDEFTTVSEVIDDLSDSWTEVAEVIDDASSAAADASDEFTTVSEVIDDTAVSAAAANEEVKELTESIKAKKAASEGASSEMQGLSRNMSAGVNASRLFSAAAQSGSVSVSMLSNVVRQLGGSFMSLSGPLAIGSILLNVGLGIKAMIAHFTDADGKAKSLKERFEALKKEAAALNDINLERFSARLASAAKLSELARKGLDQKNASEAEKEDFQHQINMLSIDQLADPAEKVKDQANEVERHERAKLALEEKAIASRLKFEQETAAKADADYKTVLAPFVKEQKAYQERAAKLVNAGVLSPKQLEDGWQEGVIDYEAKRKEIEVKQKDVGETVATGSAFSPYSGTWDTQFGENPEWRKLESAKTDLDKMKASAERMRALNGKLDALRESQVLPAREKSATAEADALKFYNQSKPQQAALIDARKSKAMNEYGQLVAAAEAENQKNKNAAGVTQLQNAVEPWQMVNGRKVDDQATRIAQGAAQKAIEQAASQIAGGVSDVEVFRKLEAALTKLNVRISMDRKAFMDVVDRFDADIGELKSQVRASRGDY